jgi:hypothetical protein
MFSGLCVFLDGLLLACECLGLEGGAYWLGVRYEGLLMFIGYLWMLGLNIDVLFMRRWDKS